MFAEMRARFSESTQVNNASHSSRGSCSREIESELAIGVRVIAACRNHRVHQVVGRITPGEVIRQSCRIAQIGRADFHSLAMHPLAILQLLRRTHQTPYRVVGIEQAWYEPAADVASYSGNRDPLV